MIDEVKQRIEVTLVGCNLPLCLVMLLAGKVDKEALWWIKAMSLLPALPAMVWPKPHLP